jgi:hypothetical protein
MEFDDVTNLDRKSGDAGANVGHPSWFVRLIHSSHDGYSSGNGPEASAIAAGLV